MKKVLYVTSCCALSGLAGLGVRKVVGEVTSKKSKILGFILNGISFAAAFATGSAVGAAIDNMNGAKELEK